MLGQVDLSSSVSLVIRQSRPVVSQFPPKTPVMEVERLPLRGGSMPGLVGDGIPELSCSPCGYGCVSLRPLYCPMNEPSSLNWMSTLSPYSTRLSSLARFRSGHSERWLKERFSSLSLLNNRIHANQIRTISRLDDVSSPHSNRQTLLISLLITVCRLGQSALPRLEH